MQSLQEEEGIEVRALRDQPTLLPEAAWLYAAFEMLSSRRFHIDGKPQPIQISEIAAYADFEEITDATMRDDLLYMVSRLDNTYLNYRPASPKTTEPRQRRR